MNQQASSGECDPSVQCPDEIDCQPRHVYVRKILRFSILDKQEKNEKGEQSKCARFKFELCELE